MNGRQFCFAKPELGYPFATHRGLVGSEIMFRSYVPGNAEIDQHLTVVEQNLQHQNIFLHPQLLYLIELVSRMTASLSKMKKGLVISEEYWIFAGLGKILSGLT